MSTIKSASLRVRKARANCSTYDLTPGAKRVFGRHEKKVNRRYANALIEEAIDDVEEDREAQVELAHLNAAKAAYAEAKAIVDSIEATHKALQTLPIEVRMFIDDWHMNAPRLQGFDGVYAHFDQVYAETECGIPRYYS